MPLFFMQCPAALLNVLWARPARGKRVSATFEQENAGPEKHNGLAIAAFNIKTGKDRLEQLERELSVTLATKSLYRL